MTLSSRPNVAAAERARYLDAIHQAIGQLGQVQRTMLALPDQFLDAAVGEALVDSLKVIEHDLTNSI